MHVVIYLLIAYGSVEIKVEIFKNHVMAFYLIPLGHNLHTHNPSQAILCTSLHANCKVQAHLVVIVQQKGNTIKLE